MGEHQHTATAPALPAAAPAFSLSERAAARIREMVGKLGKPAGGGLRVGVKGGGCSGLSYVFDFTDGPREHDQIFERDGARVFIDKKSLLFLKGTELEYVTELMSAGFRLKNPAVKQACGCGESFTI